MLIAMIDGHTRICGRSQGYNGLPVRDEMQEDNMTNIMHTAWTPTPEEIERIKAGANVIVSLIGLNPQPLLVTVAEPPK